MDDRIYPDTADGVLAMLRDSCSLDLDGATCQPDPWVRGVWLVTLADADQAAPGDPQDVLAYLAGYPDPLGDRRAFNDFEVGYRDDDAPAPSELAHALGL
jgi:hypothetical protein